ncbi:MAG: prolyl oligopeptidase family serine peptidase, partial [Planctomycetota bacterium]|nr:prolyl oligopeptidase family serine peptidase [Planctomycetota bacterium]
MSNKTRNLRVPISIWRKKGTVPALGTLVFFLINGFALVSFLVADGEKDNHPEQVRRIPRLGIVVDETKRRELEQGLGTLKSLLGRLHQSKSRFVQALVPDVEIYHRAVRDNLDHQEFFAPADVTKAKQLLQVGIERGQNLGRGDAPWLTQTGLVVRGFRSELDDTVQPYGLVIPPSYQPNGENEVRLDIWFHGRGETLSETNFIDQRGKNPGYYRPKETIVLHPYGRYSNAFKFAGEVDVLEALAHVKSQYRIDNDRVSVRGFSMGGAACWQFAFLYADQWFAANPGAGFSETPRFLKTFQKETLNPYPWEKKLWHWYDADDHAVNFFHVPTIAYSGENDIQKQAAEVMEDAILKATGLQLTHVIGPKTGHRIHVDSQKEIERRMSSLARQGNDQIPKVVHKVTHTLKYNKQYWLTITGLQSHWEPGRVRAVI